MRDARFQREDREENKADFVVAISSHRGGVTKLQRMLLKWWLVLHVTIA